MESLPHSCRNKITYPSDEKILTAHLFRICYLNYISCRYNVFTPIGIFIEPIIHKKSFRETPMPPASVGVPLLHLLNLKTCNAPAWSPHQREYEPTPAILKSVLIFQNRLCHHNRISLMNNDNLQALHIALPVQDCNVCILTFVQWTPMENKHLLLSSSMLSGSLFHTW
ncbi:hypothetical protein BH20BAC1_BH20BAC1_09010 [soil metagenome]